jgi:hypothetical protein
MFQFVSQKWRLQLNRIKNVLFHTWFVQNNMATKNIHSVCMYWSVWVSMCAFSMH